MQEPRDVVMANYVAVSVGMHSKRVFELTVKFLRSADELQSLAHNIARELTAAMKELRNRSGGEDNIGALLNRRAVERDLDLHGSVPPPWIIEALERARGERVSTS
jgi:hypothetical protein